MQKEDKAQIQSSRLTGKLRKMRRNLRSRLSRSVASLLVRYDISAVTRPLWMNSKGDMSVSLTIVATCFRLAVSSPD